MSAKIIKADEAETSPVATGLNVAVPRGHDPAALLALAVEKDLDVDKLERLMELQERWQATEARAAFNRALQRFQQLAPTIVKQNEVRGRNQHLMYKFAGLDDIRKQIAPALQDAGLTYRWEYARDDGGNVAVTCIITHVDSGHSETTTTTVPPVQGQNTNAAQNIGIAEKYGMRYSLIGALGITTADTDTDGIADEGPAEKVSDEQAANLLALAQECGGTTLKAMLEYVGVAKVADIPAARHAELIAQLEKKRGKQ